VANGRVRRRHLGSRYEYSPGLQSPLPDITSRVVVCVRSEGAEYTGESVARRPILAIDGATLRAGFACVARVHQDDGA